MEELPAEPLLGLEHNSSSFAGVTGLAEVEQVTLGTKRAGIPEDSSSLFRCTPSYGAARLLPPCSEKLTNEKETQGEESFCLLREKAIELPGKRFPLSVVEALMRKKLLLTLVEPGNFHPSSVPTMGGVRSLDFCEGNPDLCSDGLCLGAEGGFGDKASPHLHRKTPCTLSGIFTSSPEKDNVGKHWEKKQILARSTSENKCLDKVTGNGKYPKKNLIGKAKIEEIEDEKAQPQEVSCAAEENSEVLFKTELSHPGKEGMEAKDSPGGSQDDRKLSVGFKNLKKHFEGSPGLMEEQGNLSEICISHGNGVKNGEIIIKVEGEGEPHQKPTQQTNPSSTMGLKKGKDQPLKLYEPKEKILSCQKRAAKTMQCSYSQNFLCSEEERCPANLLSLSKIFLPGSSFYESFCHLAALEAGKEWNGKIKALEKVVAVCSERIALLMQENEKYSEKIWVLQQENERYTEVMCALEEEMDAYFQYILEVDEASFQNLVNEKEIAGGCFTNLAEENTVKPGIFFVETFCKKLSCVEEKTRNSEKGSVTIASKKLPRSVSSLDGRKMRCLQLLSDLKEERSRCSTEIAKLLQDKENSVAKYNELIQEREENLQRIALLEGEKETLLGCLAEVTCEKDKYRTLISELQECKTSCYQTISALQEEKDVLKREMDKIKRETSEQLDEFQKANINFISENSKLKEFMTSLGFTREELIKNKSLGTKERTVKQKEESQHCALKPKKVEAVSKAAQTEEEALVIDTSDYFPGKEGRTFASYSMMKKQVEKAKEELEKQQKELEKSKKEAQKWYTELGFAETRYEETQTRLTQVLAEFNHLKQEVGDKMPGKQACKLMPVLPVQDGQEMQENKIAKKRLQQQVLTLKAQLRDQAAFQNHFHDLQDEVELLQAQLAGKEKELQKKKCEEKLMLAPLKAKLACLTQKCQERNSFITRMQAEFHSHGIIHPALDEEVKKLVNDMTLAEYTAAFTSVCGSEMVPPSTDISEASGQPGDQETDVTGNGMTGFIPVNSLQEMDGTCSSCITPNKLTSPERIIALHQELRQNHGKNYQIPPAGSSNSNPKADCKLPRIQEEAPWPLLSGMKDGLVPAEHRAFWVTKGRDWLSRCDDGFWGQIRKQPAGAIPQGMKQKNATMNKAWLSREKTDGSSSATTAESCLSDTLAASNKG
ncbi:early endosome antigen 1-like [Heliangelus exortis]|uniref:early endosome antigen 1-like n=1 Tax=Heliangelus exortis TaxID=472823 RepID=UPI003A948135